MTQLLSAAQVEDRLRRDLPVLADDVADRDDDPWTTAATPPGLRVAMDPHSRLSVSFLASVAAVVVLAVAVGIAMSRDSARVATRIEEPASGTPTTLAPNTVHLADQPGGDAELLRLRRVADGVEVTIWRWDGHIGGSPPLEPIGANSGYFAPHPEDPANGSVVLQFDLPTLAESSFLTISGPTEIEGELRSLAAGIVREDAGGQVTYVIAVPEGYDVVPAAQE
jgi:hypothetical protein